MVKIIHISDLHFHASSEKNEETKLLLDKIRTKYFSDQSCNCYLLITGDITDDGRDAQQGQAFEALKHFKDKLLLLPGNHDYGTIGNFYSPEKARLFDTNLLAKLNVSHQFFNKEVCFKNLAPSLNFIGLNSVSQTSTLLDFACGEIGIEQRSKFSEIITALKNSTNIVGLHHRPGSFWGEPVLGLKDSSEFMDIVFSNNVNVLAFGHSGKKMRDPEPAKNHDDIKSLDIKGTYFLNANASVSKCSCFEIEYDGVKLIKPIIQTL